MNKFFLISTVVALTPLCSWGEISSSPAASASPTVSQRRGRMLLPPGTPAPTANGAGTPIPKPVKQPTAIEEPTLIPAPSAPPESGSQKPPRRGQLKSQAQKFNPGKVVPMPSGSPSPKPESSAKSKGGWTSKGFKVPNESSSPGTTVTASPNAASTPPSASAGKLTKQEKKEQKREERKELKGEQREGSENASPSATP